MVIILNSFEDTVVWILFKKKLFSWLTLYNFV